MPGLPQHSSDSYGLLACAPLPCKLPSRFLPPWPRVRAGLRSGPSLQTMPLATGACQVRQVPTQRQHRFTAGMRVWCIRCAVLACAPACCDGMAVLGWWVWRPGKGRELAGV